jgi:acyl carrier protein
LGHIIDEHRVSFISSVPALWRVATRHNPPSYDSLARVHIGSAPLSTGLWSDVAAWSRAEVANCYGLTETANWVAGASSRTDRIAEGLVGKPWGTTVAIMKDGGAIQESGDGEIVVRSPALMSGYLDRPDLTATVLRGGWFHTGDRGSVDGQGSIWLTGRIKDEINRAGFKIQPAEIDMLLERHPAVAEACVFGIADPTSGESVAVAIRPASGANISPQILKTWCLERLRRGAVPEHWFIVDELPRTARGKISRDAVRQMFAPPVGAHKRLDKAAPHDVQIKIARASEPLTNTGGAPRVRSAVERAWAETFGNQSLAMNLSWDECGGDSIDVLRLWFSIEQELGVQLTFDVLEPGATPNTLAAAIEKILGSSPAPMDGHTPDGPPLVFFMPPMEGDSPPLARFRAAFEDKFRFAVVHYPTWREMIAAGGSFDPITNAAIAQVRKQYNAGPSLCLGLFVRRLRCVGNRAKARRIWGPYRIPRAHRYAAREPAASATPARQQKVALDSLATERDFRPSPVVGWRTVSDKGCIHFIATIVPFGDAAASERGHQLSYSPEPSVKKECAAEIDDRSS